MKIVCSQQSLIKGINTVLRAIPTRTTLPILECILIEAADGNIKFTSNNMEMAIETVVDGTIAEEGSIALNAKLFSDIVRKLPDNDVTIDTDDSFKANIKCEKSSISISGKSSEDFIFIPEIEKKGKVEMSQFALKEVIRQTIFSISDNDSNQMLKGELFEVKDGKLTIASLDGHRISIRYINLSDGNENVRVVVPGKTLGEIAKILPGDAESKVNIYFTNLHVMFEFEETKVVSRLIDGEYFQIQRMISSDYSTKIKINKKKLMECLDRATLFDRDGDRKPVILSIENDNINIRIESLLGDMNEDLEVEKEGDDLIICFNARYLIDALRAIDDEKVSIYMTNAKSPCVIKDKDSYIYLIVPVNYNVGPRK